TVIGTRSVGKNALFFYQIEVILSTKLSVSNRSIAAQLEITFCESISYAQIKAGVAYCLELIGSEGAVVAVKVVRAGQSQPVEFKFTREAVPLPSVSNCRLN